MSFETSCRSGIDEIDADRIALKRKVEGSVQRLESQTLIGRSGEDYFFLTNQERDVSRDIKAIDLSLPGYTGWCRGSGWNLKAA